MSARAIRSRLRSDGGENHSPPVQDPGAGLRSNAFSFTSLASEETDFEVSTSYCFFPRSGLCSILASAVQQPSCTAPKSDVDSCLAEPEDREMGCYSGCRGGFHLINEQRRREFKPKAGRGSLMGRTFILRQHTRTNIQAYRCI